MDIFTRLTADELNKQEPGTLVSRFVGDVDMVENLFTSGIISMFADACRIISILAVIWFQNRGLALVFVILLPALFGFTRFVQKRMLAAQLENLWEERLLLCRNLFTIFGRSIALEKKITWKSGMTSTLARATGPWRKPTFMTQDIPR